MSGLKIYAGNKMETLAEKLSGVMSASPLPAMKAETIVVLSQGMERWVSMELARRLGICANCRFPFLNTFVQDIFSRVFPRLGERGEKKFNPDIMTWKIMQLLPGMLNRPVFSGVRAYLGKNCPELKRYQLAARIARAFDQYQVYRPEMIIQWGQDRRKKTKAEQGWQAELWQEMTKNHSGLDRSSLREKFLKWTENHTDEKNFLPLRVNVFGVSSLSAFYMDIFVALARQTEVNLFLMKPSMSLGSAEDEQTGSPGNRLLEYMGAQGYDFFRLNREITGVAGELFEDPGESNMLSCLQSDVLNNRSRNGTGAAGRKTIEEQDDSFQVHACHNIPREIEVLHDNLLSMFERDPGLRPGDILVMTPQIEDYAPYIQSVFDTPEQERIPFSIADRSLGRSNPVAEGFLGILELNKGRFGASEVLSLLETREIAGKFNLSPADLELVRYWVEQTRIKWGVDADHRARLGLPRHRENTWRAGIDRLLLGYAMAGEGERMFQGILPYDDLEGTRSHALGQFLEFFSLLVGQVEDFGEARSLNEWSATLGSVLDLFFEPDEETRAEFQWLKQAVNRLAEEGEVSGFTEKAGFEVVRHWLRSRLEERISGTGFITGGVTFCSMVPMRSIGFKVICLVGLNNDIFPRSCHSTGFDLMQREPKSGDPSRRNEDRYLFLEAVLAAREKLYISYIGRSDLDNSAIPPSVVVSELLDYAERGFSHPQKNIREHVVTTHRLQAFNPDYFSSGSGLFSYSEQNCRAAIRALEPGKPEAPGTTICLPAPEEEWKTVEIEDLEAFLGNPARFFMKRRLGIYLEQREKPAEDREVFDLVQLEKFFLREELAQEGIKGHNPEDFYDIARAAGRLPHGEVGRYFYRLTTDEVETFLEAVQSYRGCQALEPLEVDLDIDGYRIIGRLTDIFQDTLLRFRPSAVKPKDRLRTWLHHLLLCALQPEGYPRTSLFLGHDRQCRFRPVANSMELLARLIELYREGLSSPLKFFPETSWAFARATVKEGKSAWQAAIKAEVALCGNKNQVGEIQDPYLELCFSGVEKPLDDQFQKTALELYSPLIEHWEEAGL
jgi:exodeoxyribonuclease V gamma subunit